MRRQIFLASNTYRRDVSSDVSLKHVKIIAIKCNLSQHDLLVKGNVPSTVLPVLFVNDTRY